MYAVLREHEIFEIIQKPFSSDSFDISGRINVDGHIGEVFVYIRSQLQRLSRSILSYLSCANLAKPLL